MKKSHAYDIMSNRKRKNCGEVNRIKKRMAEKRDSKLCYKCFEAIRSQYGLSTTALKKRPALAR